ncbi:MAG: alanine--tRNA ligase [Thermoplasmata archaeon]|nr:MAG: alanine--tRNA ligase [Thermoplasmata archaeon]
MDEFLKKELNLQYFQEKGYTRKKCVSCGAYFWTLQPESIVCGDQPCVPFSFINNPIGKKTMSLSDVRSGFLSYFEQHNHQRLHFPITNERMPVIARWRTDIYLTIASIADFQPHVTSGEVPPPANPLVISQPCIRLNDLDEVGKSGRHLTLFEMMGHHAFNKNVDEIYFKEDTVKYCNDFFTNTIRIPKEEINYKEELWNGGGNAGPCLEVVAKGLEIATLVFMNMKADSAGTYTIANEQYTNNPLNIVDTGYGLERIAWITNGSKTVYETVLNETIKWISDHAKNLEDKKILYSLADHSKSLSFMLGDGIVPSNVKAGYLARLLIRRCLRFIKSLHLDASLIDLVDYQLLLLKSDFPSLINQQNQIQKMLNVETKRYSDTISKGKLLVNRLIKEKQQFDSDTLITLYDTHGMPPSIVKQIAQKQQIPVSIPENFESMIAELHTHRTEKQEKKERNEKLPETTSLYYKDHYLKEFDATVLFAEKTSQGTRVILDKTTFYPEGGGQPGDKGFFLKDGINLPLTEVTKEQGTIFHHIKGELKKDDFVHGTIDWDHRYTIMKHHTGTHIINGALQDILGAHIWQAGSQLGYADARFDYTHFEPLTDGQVKEIEKRANEFITMNVPVNKLILDRNTAEKQFGFRLYQGGVPPGNEIRVLDIPGVDVEACGGTHVNNTAEIEKIRIIRSERIQDGVNRIIFAAGKMVDAYQKEEQQHYKQIIESFQPIFTITTNEHISNELKKTSDLFSVPINQLEKTIKRFIKEAKPTKQKSFTNLSVASLYLFDLWKKNQKQKKTVDMETIETLKDQAESIPGTEFKVITAKISMESNATAGAIITEPNYIVHIYDGKKITSAASENVPINLQESIVKAIGEILGGSGGGRQRMTQSGGPNLDRVDEALEQAKQLTVEILKK